MGLTASPFTPFEKNSKSIESMLWDLAHFTKDSTTSMRPIWDARWDLAHFTKKIDHFNGPSNQDAEASNA